METQKKITRAMRGEKNGFIRSGEPGKSAIIIEDARHRLKTIKRKVNRKGKRN
jgi:hypothetical protein